MAEILRPVNGAHYPAFLPGLTPGRTFVFGDTLGLHAVAMVTADDPEPKATLALLGRLLGGDEATAPSVGERENGDGPRFYEGGKAAPRKTWSVPYFSQPG
jgi:hypothetical protein